MAFISRRPDSTAQLRGAGLRVSAVAANQAHGHGCDESDGGVFYNTDKDDDDGRESKQIVQTIFLLINANTKYE